MRNGQVTTAASCSSLVVVGMEKLCNWLSRLRVTRYSHAILNIKLFAAFQWSGRPLESVMLRCELHDAWKHNSNCYFISDEMSDVSSSTCFPAS